MARVGYVYLPNTRHLDAFEKAGIGSCAMEDYVTERRFDSQTYPEGKLKMK